VTAASARIENVLEHGILRVNVTHSGVQLLDCHVSIARDVLAVNYARKM